MMTRMSVSCPHKYQKSKSIDTIPTRVGGVSARVQVSKRVGHVSRRHFEVSVFWSYRENYCNIIYKPKQV